MRGDNYDRVIDTILIVTGKGTEQETKWTPEAFIAHLRTKPGWAEWFEEFDNGKEGWVRFLESMVTNAMCDRVAEAVGLFFTEIGTLIQTPTGFVSLDIFNKRTRLRTTMLRVQGRGGANNQKLDSSNENERRELGVEYTRLYETYRYINRRFRGCIREGQDWRKHLKLDYPELEEYTELLDIVGIMNKDTATLASNDEQRIEELLNLQIENPSDLALEIAARRVIDGYTWCHPDTLRRHKIDPA